jgi:signal transduction histidine kinase
MSFLIKDVLNYSHVTKTTEPFIDIDLNYIIQYIMSDFEHAIEQKQATIRFSDLPVVKGIPGQMLQLFSNLISNSLKYCEGNPAIRISSRLLPADEVLKHPSLKPGTAYAEISCTDNGIGFEQQYAEQIFVIFQRLHHRGAYGGGTGMGLAICRKIAEKHNGSITASGDTGKGATFTVILPVQ